MTKTVRTVKVKAGQEKLRERIKDALAQKGARAHVLINKLAADNKAVVWRYAELDAIALELRHLAFQIRTLKNAKTATEEAGPKPPAPRAGAGKPREPNEKGKRR